jgi:ribosomal protein L11 methyltransferase
MDYTKIDFVIFPREPWSAILMDELAHIGFDSFTEENDSLQAFIPSDSINKNEILSLLDSFDKKKVDISYTEELIPSQNWNALWESDFKPVEIDEELIIYAPFHNIDLAKYKHSVEIQPQMSFGTGHHQTTFLLSKALLKLQFKGKTVLDVGTGTGILGILAAKLGAKSVFGTDIEPGAYENAIENIRRNEVKNFNVALGDINVVPKENYDVIIANINKNVLKSHMSEYAKHSVKGGILMLSGFFDSDILELENEAKKSNFILIEVLTFQTWAVMLLKQQ